MDTTDPVGTALGFEGCCLDSLFHHNAMAYLHCLCHVHRIYGILFSCHGAFTFLCIRTRTMGHPRIAYPGILFLIAMVKVWHGHR